MRQLYYNIILAFFAFCLFACQADEDKIAQQTGYLRLSIGQTNSVETKAEETYNPKMFSVKILDEKGEQYGSIIEDVSESVAKEIPLKTGSYTVQVYSANYDEEAGFGKAYYSGSTKVTIEGGKTTQASVTCTLANVMVTVRFSNDFKKKFEGRDFTVQVGSQTQDAFTPLNFTLAKEGEKAYIPVGAFQATISIPKSEGQSGNYTLTNKFDNVKAQQHYAITYKLQEEGTGDFTVKYDPSTNSLNYDFYLTTNPTNQATLTANAWSHIAYLKAENVTASSGTDISILKFQYKLKTANDKAWADVTTEKKEETENETYEAKITGLTANTTYQYRLVNEDGSFETTASEFTTETEIALQNGNFDAWSTIETEGLFSAKRQSAYPNASASIKFWDTSNAGANYLSVKNPTQGTTEDVHTTGENAKAAKLTSVVNGAFAAASLYTGTFGNIDFTSFGATLTFGQSFSARPIILKGFYKYKPVNVNNVGNNLPADATVSKGNPDQCSIYIALAKKSYLINNKDESTFIKFADDPNIIAYGELPSGAATEGDDYVEFNIPLKYKKESFDEKPTHIIIVCSASKYGDYMTGGEGSTLFLDDFELIYDGEPTMWE